MLIPYSDQTHGHFTHYYAAVWKPYLISFMGRSARPRRLGDSACGREPTRRSWRTKSRGSSIYGHRT